MAKLPEYFHFRVLEGRTKIGIKDVSDHDFVEVVRCKDCKHSDHWYGNKSRCFLWHENGIDVFNDGFCTYGEKEKKADGT